MVSPLEGRRCHQGGAAVPSPAPAGGTCWCCSGAKDTALQTAVARESRAAFGHGSCRALCTLTAPSHTLIFFLLVQSPDEVSAPSWTLHQ